MLIKIPIIYFKILSCFRLYSVVSSTTYFKLFTLASSDMIFLASVGIIVGPSSFLLNHVQGTSVSFIKIIIKNLSFGNFIREFPPLYNKIKFLKVHK